MKRTIKRARKRQCLTKRYLHVERFLIPLIIKKACIKMKLEGKSWLDRLQEITEGEYYGL